MTKLGPYEVHPLADAFPLIEGEEFDALVADILKNGLNEPIVLNHDKTVLIDGRNRWRACEAATVDVVHRTLGPQYTEDQIVDYIVSANLARRHLNVGQRSMLAQEVEQAYAASSKEAQRQAAVRTNAVLNGDTDKITALVADLPQVKADENKARVKAAQALNVSPRAVQQAKAVCRDAPDLAVRVRAGQLALDAADRARKARIAARPKPEQVKSTARTITLLTHNGEPVEYPQPQGKATFNTTPGEGISWAAWSWNPVTGCLHGCDYCYAREIATSERYRGSYPAGFTPLFHRERLGAPANTTVPAAHRDDPSWRRVFVCSMADLYGRWVPDEWIDEVHASCVASPQWDYLTLTKFPSRYVGLTLPPTAWVGTSVDEQKRVRIAEDAFRDIKDVRVKWLSLEPLREPLSFTDLSMFDWVVIGAQTETYQPSGTVRAFAPPFEWVARIVSQAREAGCRIHMKPNLFTRPGMVALDEYPTPNPTDIATIH